MSKIEHFGRDLDLASLQARCRLDWGTQTVFSAAAATGRAKKGPPEQQGGAQWRPNSAVGLSVEIPRRRNAEGTAHAFGSVDL